MNDETSPSSGSRWEPADTPADLPTDVPTDVPPEPAEPTPVAVETTAAAPARRPTWLTRARGGVAAGAAAVLLAGGLGGFAIGRASAGSDDGPGTRQQGVPTGFDREGDGAGPGGPMLGQLPDGQVPDRQGPDDGGDGTNDGTDGTDSSDT
jgi:hypothetical protein